MSTLMVDRAVVMWCTTVAVLSWREREEGGEREMVVVVEGGEKCWRRRVVRMPE